MVMLDVARREVFCVLSSVCMGKVDARRGPSSFRVDWPGVGDEGREPLPDIDDRALRVVGESILE